MLKLVEFSLALKVSLTHTKSIPDIIRHHPHFNVIFEHFHKAVYRGCCYLMSPLHCETRSNRGAIFNSKVHRGLLTFYDNCGNRCDYYVNYTSAVH